MSWRAVSVLIIFLMGMIVGTSGALAGEGALAITSDPKDAEVWVDGEQKVSGTPAVLKLSSSKHSVIVKKSGFRSETFEVFIDGAVVTKSVELVVQPDQKAVSNLSGSGKVFKDCDDCPEMVVIPPGTFRMGDLYGDNGDGNKDGMPIRKVTIAKPFAMGRYTVIFDDSA